MRAVLKNADATSIFLTSKKSPCNLFMYQELALKNHLTYQIASSIMEIPQPRKPCLNSLKGSMVLPTQIRDALDLEEGVLVCQVRD